MKTRRFGAVFGAVVLFGLLGFACRSVAFGQTDEPLGLIRSDPHIIRAQIELGLAHLSTALSALETATSPEELEAISGTAYQAYRMLRWATHGLEGLISKRFANPLHRAVTDSVWQARWAIIAARSALANAAQWPEGRQAHVAAALAKLREAKAYAEQAQLLM